MTLLGMIIIGISYFAAGVALLLAIGIVLEGLNS
jgi:hypothetical protein